MRTLYLIVGGNARAANAARVRAKISSALASGEGVGTGAVTPRGFCIPARSTF
jgi:hypothetical protein